MSYAQAELAEVFAPALDRQPNTVGLCVLVVEDDDADAYLIERALAGNPDVASVVRAADGVEALRLIDAGAVEPDFALIDLHMPRKNGFSLLVDLACRRQPCFPMVVLTSSTAPTDAVRSRLRGATRVLTKPDTVEELEVLLATAITSACSGVILPPRSRSKRRDPAEPKASRFSTERTLN